MLDGVDHQSEPIAVAERAIATLCEPLVVGGHALQCGPSVGIALDSPRAAPTTALLHDADLAMYAAKERGEGRHAVFASGIQDRSINPGPTS